jgi:large subunit ribosomal protein L5
MTVTPRLKEEYTKKYRGEILNEMKLDNVMDVPRIRKIVVSVGIGDAVDDSAVNETVSGELASITGQKPVPATARGAISAFQIRRGDVIGLKVTLRGPRMWEFLDKLVNVALPRTRDFRGLSPDAFDGNGNYTIGIEEQTIFPEIDPNAVTKMRGLEITIVTSTDDDARARALLDKFGFPFRKDGEKV